MANTFEKILQYRSDAPYYDAGHDDYVYQGYKLGNEPRRFKHATIRNDFSCQRGHDRHDSGVA